jgi:hypothetical protein
MNRPKPKPQCSVCGGNPEAKNTLTRECGHVDCPSRSRCWSEIESAPPGGDSIMLAEERYVPRRLIATM